MLLYNLYNYKKAASHLTLDNSLQILYIPSFTYSLYVTYAAHH